MSDYPVTRGSRSGDPHPTLRLVALTAVIVGVVLVAGAAFLLSYNGIHQIALQAGVSPGLAKLYPLMFDAMLVIACAATLSVRNAGWGAKCYAWVSLLLLVCAVAVGDALHATGVHLDGQVARAAIAIIPWVLLMMGFGLWLVMLRQWRRARAAAAANGTAVVGNAVTGGAVTGGAVTGGAVTGGAVTGAAAAGAAAAGGAVTWAGGRDAPPARSGSSRPGMDTLLERPAGRAPDRPAAAESPAAGERAATKDQQVQQRRTGAPAERQPAAAAAGKGQDGGHEGGSGDRNGDADQAGNGTTPVGGRNMPTGAAPERSTTFEALPAAAAGRGGPGGGAKAANPAGAAGAGRAAGTAAAAGAAGAAGIARTAGTAETGGTAGAARTAEAAGTTETAGTARAAETAGAAETARAARTVGAARTAGAAGTTETAGTAGAAGTAEEAGTAGAAETAGTAGTGAAAESASARDDSQAAEEEGTQAGAGDHVEPPPPMPAPAPLPLFDRLRSTPTPPQETGASGE